MFILSDIPLLGRAHWSVVGRILSYLSGTINFGLRYGGGQCKPLTGYSDADFAKETWTRGALSPVTFFSPTEDPLSGRVASKDYKALSTTKAKYIAGCEASKEAIWITSLMKELKLEGLLPAPLYCDNQSAIRLAKNPEFHQRTKHIDVKYHFITEQVEKRVISLEFVGTEDQHADLFTKPLKATRFQNLMGRIGMVDVNGVLV